MFIIQVLKDVKRFMFANLTRARNIKLPKSYFDTILRKISSQYLNSCLWWYAFKASLGNPQILARGRKEKGDVDKCKTAKKELSKNCLGGTMLKQG